MGRQLLYNKFKNVVVETVHSWGIKIDGVLLSAKWTAKLASLDIRLLAWLLLMGYTEYCIQGALCSLWSCMVKESGIHMVLMLLKLLETLLQL